MATVPCLLAARCNGAQRGFAVSLRSCTTVLLTCAVTAVLRAIGSPPGAWRSSRAVQRDAGQRRPHPDEPGQRRWHEGPSVASQQAIAIGCRLQGFTVADGSTWWYRIASSPWNNAYYVGADAFYNGAAPGGA